jgi:hypothetical protein
MWIFISDAFFSIVEDGQQANKLLVRARFKGHIERVFPQAKVSETPESDYRYRTSLPRMVVTEAIAHKVAEIDYGNFKDSIKFSNPLHEAAGQVWNVMYQAQQDEVEDARRHVILRQIAEAERLVGGRTPTTAKGRIYRRKANKLRAELGLPAV